MLWNKMLFNRKVICLVETAIKENLNGNLGHTNDVIVSGVGRVTPIVYVCL